MYTGVWKLQMIWNMPAVNGTLIKKIKKSHKFSNLWDLLNIFLTNYGVTSVKHYRKYVCGKILLFYHVYCNV